MKPATTCELTLFSTSACHLCEQALALLQPWLAQGWRLREVDISESEELFARYAVSIPVLRLEPSGSELGWPFSAGELGEFLQPGDGQGEPA